MSLTTVVFIVVYIAGLVLALGSGAHWAFYLYQIVYFFNPENRWWSQALPSVSYSMITVGFLLFTYFGAHKKYGSNSILKLPLFKWLMFFLSTYLIAYYFAVDSVRHDKFTIDLIKMIIVIGLAYKCLNTQKKLEWALITYLVGAAYIGYEAFIVGRDGFGRVEGIGMVDAPEANGTAAAIAPAISLLIFYFWRGGVKLKIATVVMGAFIVNGLILINSRGAFLGAAFSGVFLILEMLRGRVSVRNQRLATIMLILMGVFGVATLVDEGFTDRMSTMTEVSDESKSGSNRYRLWLVALEMSFEYPFGVGIAGYEKLSPAYVPEELFIGGQTRKAVHSIWMQALSEVGWIGLISFLMIMLWCYRFLAQIKAKSKKDNNSYNYYLAHALLSSFFGLLLTSSFINQLRVQLIYWMVLFISCFYGLVVINDHESDSGDSAIADSSDDLAGKNRPS